MDQPILLAGYPDRYPGVYHRCRFLCGDMVVILDGTSPGPARTIIVRNIEVERAREQARADEVYCPEDLAPSTGLASNRNLTFAQAAAELLRRRGITEVVSDQMLPLLFVDVLAEAGIRVRCDRDLGILDRRRKDEWEIGQLRLAQQGTELGIDRAYRVLKACTVAGGELHFEGELLTSARLRAEINAVLLANGMLVLSEAIVAGGPIGADCHQTGAGPLRPGEPIIIDVFPLHGASRYFGDCTRTFVTGDVSPQLAAMHEAVVQAKAAAIAACRPGVTGAEVHAAAADLLRLHGYHASTTAQRQPTAEAGSRSEGPGIHCPHGTGHGIGLEVHEPPLLDERADDDVLIEGDVLTIEPGLYAEGVGGIRVEDMVVVRADGCENLNTLPEGLWWD